MDTDHSYALTPATAVPDAADIAAWVGPLLAAAGDCMVLRDQHSQRVLWCSAPLRTDRRRGGADGSQAPLYWIDLIHADDAVRMQQVYSSLREDESYDCDYRARLHDECLAWRHEHGRAVRLRSGAAAVIGLVRNTGRLHELTRRAEECEAYARRLVATSPGAFFWYRRSPDGQAESRFANPKVAAAYGLRQPGVSGIHDDVFEIIHPQDRERVREAVDESTRSLKPVKQEFRVRHLRAGELWTELHVVPVQNDGGAVSWDGFLQDVTARKQAELALASDNALLERRVMERTHELEQRARDIEMFSHAVSHDLRAPLRAIDAYGKLLHDRAQALLDDECRGFLGSVLLQAARMNRLVEDLLKFVRMDASVRDVRPLDLQRLVSDAVDFLSYDIARRQVGIELDLQCTRVRGEHTGLLLAVRNVLDNALKYGRQDGSGRIKVISRRQQDRCLLSIADNGDGFSPASRERIFDIFHRLRASSADTSTGIGLTLVRRALQRMGARIWADAVPGAGATFFIDLPAEEPPAADDDRDDSTLPPAAGPAETSP